MHLSFVLDMPKSGHFFLYSRPSPYAPLYSTTLHRDRDTDYLDWHSAYPGVGGRKAASAAAKPRVFAKESKNNSGEGFITHDSLTLGLPAQVRIFSMNNTDDHQLHVINFIDLQNTPRTI